MTTTNPQDAVCDTLEADFAQREAALNKINQEQSGAISGIRNAMKSVVPIDDIQGIIDGIADQTPNLGDETSDAVSDVISNCSYLNSNKALGNINNALRGLRGAYLNDARKVTDALTPEFDVAKQLKVLNDLLDSLGLSDNVGKMDQILNCLSSVCGRETQDKIDRMQSTMNQMGLDSSGRVNSNTLAIDTGIDDLSRININSAYDKVVDIDDQVNNAFGALM